MDDLSASLRKLMQERSLSQAQVGRDAHVSQASVSRAIRASALRSGAARRRLIKYIQEQERRRLPDQMAEAFRSVWDGTDAHEAALARLIQASAELWPRLKEGADHGTDE